ncbi:MAG: T9SS C-terminal target domain-containing protein, partial [Flavobacteriales bacterium]
GGESIGMEIRGQAFSFATNDEINDMTFYNYEMINRSTQTLFDTYFGQNVDTDLGCAQDDYVGCDVGRGLGYAYNADATDDNCTNGAIPYGSNPPAIGVDFFEGPYQDNNGIPDDFYVNGALGADPVTQAVPGNGIGYGDSIIDNERFGMRRFVYYNNSNTGNQNDPDNQIQHYNYLQGLWKDGVKFQYGGDAYPAPVGTSTSGVDCDFMFPSNPATGVNTDPEGWGTGGNTSVASTPWSEVSVSNPAGDRRFLQSAGPFILEPGALNNITVGVVYGRGTSGNLSSIAKLTAADDKAQSLFDNCFEILEGPDAPKMTIQELDKELILTIDPTANGADIENYSKIDVTIDTSLILPENDTINGKNNFYTFEGYQIYQLKDISVSATDIYDIDKSRLVAQFDIKNGVTQLINYSIDPIMGVGVPTLFANGADEGIKHSLRVTQDLFAKGDPTLVNHKTYYFLIIAYGYNNFKQYDPTDAGSLDGQQKPYISSRKGWDGGEIASYPGIPHIPTPEANGTVQNANYGDGMEIVRVEGMGNGGRELDLTDASRLEVARNGRVDELTYAAGKGPIDVKVIDPLNLPSDQYEVRFIRSATDDLDDAEWEIKRLSDDSITPSDRNIVLGNEQLFPDYGFSINIEQYLHEDRDVRTDLAPGAGGPEPATNLIDWSVTYGDITKPWLSGFPDSDGNSSFNWIRSGTQVVRSSAPIDPNNIYNDYQGLDDEEQFEGIAGGSFAPFRLLSTQIIDHSPFGGTGFSGAHGTFNGMLLLHSVDVVYTQDKSLWTRCPVVETQDRSSLAEGGVRKLELRDSPSIDKQGKKAGDADYNAAEGDLTGTTGMGWFPGYVIDVETGERLNVAYGEDSWLALDNGRDMMFNPTSTFTSGLGNIIAGGKHYLYIFRNNGLVGSPAVISGDPDPNTVYDEGENIYNRMNGSTADKLRVWRSCMWVGMPMTARGQEFLSTDAILKVRVETDYERYANKGKIVRRPSSYTGNDEGDSRNDWDPLYRFDTESVATGKNVLETAQDGLELINVVPNPYYAYSNYETNRLDSRIKFTNLPEKCNVRIYNVGGSLIRTLTKDDPMTSLDWDLKNINGVPIAGGLYIVHIEVPGVGEKVIKWFGAIRPPDLTNF